MMNRMIIGNLLHRPMRSLIVPSIFNNVLGADPRNAVVLGGISMLVAAVTVLGVRDVHAAD